MIEKTVNENINHNREKDYIKKGYIKTYHLYYLLGIAVIIIILLTSFIFKSSEYAGSMLAFAATLSSVLLAVIAIIITLIDVSGQKQNVFDMKKEIERLSEIVNKSSSFSKELDRGLTKIENRYQENTNLLSSLYKLVEESKLDDEPEEFYEKAKKLFGNNIDNYNRIKNSVEFKKTMQDLRIFVYENPGMKPTEVINHFSESFPSYVYFYQNALDHLIFSEEFEYDENGGLKTDLPF
ncbi:hypothetical protein CSV80_13395 [Sporosarcina sp. P12(2017)]|uniref:hypothetical protein n=1 Tax=unclassified Sporosarcina TaxID=2647733 RepID=UPI000C17207B|nr:MULTISPECIES: hypothetical protein [unclassified Sporosarcina]PIC56665.1 hypothetical protein CSV81_12830 [Sporosarcina sp. P10]PIC59882.1 hypothetical protein CSV80_13395 [Sporosarcina sp. P12(2017)]